MNESAGCTKVEHMKVTGHLYTEDVLTFQNAFHLLSPQ